MTPRAEEHFAETRPLGRGAEVCVPSGKHQRSMFPGVELGCGPCGDELQTNDLLEL